MRLAMSSDVIRCAELTVCVFHGINLDAGTFVLKLVNRVTSQKNLDPQYEQQGNTVRVQDVEENLSL